ncbi:MAG: hypothetical protein BGO38_12950 [Cellulomonas sp. 73-145]|nr:DUF3515 family protein [Cellulomonas sp.]OJV59690.1 MAG: hypothetical protein BGO38_12950 [Cellulomonas sp. 73-145]
MPAWRRRAVLRTSALLGAAVTAGSLAGCASTVPVAVATHATDPVCADVVLSTPDVLGPGLHRLATSAQATTAWGTKQAPVVLRCGVEPPGPTTERCETIQTPNGPSIDWLVIPADAAASSTGAPTDWTFVTYGRVPAVEVHVPAEVAAQRSTSFLDALGPAIARTAKERSCV